VNAVDFLLLRYRDLHRGFVHDLPARLSESQIRGRPQPGVNTIAWLLWHAARVEDVGVNRFITDGRQVFHDGWPDRLAVSRRDVGTGMTDAEVDDLSAVIDLPALRGYWEAVMARTAAVVETLRDATLDDPVPADRVERTVSEEGVVAAGAEWLTEFWGAGRSRGWFLAQLPSLHVYGHYFEAQVVAGLWGVRGR
jgi:hypothetical protein